MNSPAHPIPRQEAAPQVDHLQRYLVEHTLVGDGPGREEAIRQMLALPCALQDNPHYPYIENLVTGYESAHSAQIDPWIEALVAVRPEMAASWFVGLVNDAFNIEAVAALLRAGVDLTIPAPGRKIVTRAYDERSSKMEEVSPIAAMLRHFDEDSVAILEKKGLLPRFAHIPYAGRVHRSDGSVAEIDLLDYLVTWNPGPAAHLFILDRLDLDKPAVKMALAGAAATLLKKLAVIQKNEAYDTDEFMRGDHAERAMLMIGAGADLDRLVASLDGENCDNLPHTMACVRKDEFRAYIVQGMKNIANAAQAKQADTGWRRLFRINSRNRFGATPLHAAAGLGYPEIMDCLVAAGGHVNALSNKMDTPLHMAAKFGNAKHAEILLNAGAKVNLRNRDDLRAEEVAQNGGHEHIAQMIAVHRARQAIAGILNRANPARANPSPT